MTTAETPSGEVSLTSGLPDPAEVEVADESWRRTVRVWHLAFYAMIAISALAVGTSVSEAAQKAVSLGAMAVLVVAYSLIGIPAARSRDPRMSMVYLLLLVAVTAVAVRSHPLGSILLFIAFSQIWFFTDRRRTGVLLCALLTTAVWVAFVLRLEPDSEEMLSLAGQMVLSLLFSILLGLWISQVVEQSQERAVLVHRLRAAQAELGRSHHAAGVAAERERMAQEIHDTLAQGFTSIVMLSQTAEEDLRRGRPERAADRIALVERTARENLAEARALVAAFAPVGLDGSSLGEALERLARRFEEETGVRVAVRLAPAGSPLGREREVVLLRAAQEALANVRRHAQAQHVELVLAGGADDEVRLEVVDDGRGIDPEQAEGFGLRGMRERVTSGGGDLVVSSPAQGGTRVLVTLPASPAGAA